MKNHKGQIINCVDMQGVGSSPNFNDATKAYEVKFLTKGMGENSQILATKTKKRTIYIYLNHSEMSQ